MVSATVIVTGSAIVVLAVALIAYYSLTGKKVNGQALTSLDLSGTDSKGNTLYLSVANGAVKYDIIYIPNSDGQQLLTRYKSDGPSRWDVSLNSTNLKVIGQWENMISAETIYTNPTMTVDGNTITLTIDNQMNTITLDPNTNAPTSFGAFTVNSFNAGAFASRPTAYLADPTSDQVFDSPSIPFNFPTSSKRNLGSRRNLGAALGITSDDIKMKNCLNEVAWLAYKTSGGTDYTVYINTCPTYSGSHGVYANSNTDGTAIHGDGGYPTAHNGGYCFTEKQTQYCYQVLNGKRVVGFQGTSTGGAALDVSTVSNLLCCLSGRWLCSFVGASCYDSTKPGYQDFAYDVNIYSDNGQSGYNGALGYSTSDTQAIYDYCTGHSLGGARAKYAGTKGRCKNVVTFAAPIVDYGSASIPITQYQRIKTQSSCGYCYSGNYVTFMDIVPQVGNNCAFGCSLNDNVIYSKINSVNDLTWTPTNGECVAGITATGYCQGPSMASFIGSMHVFGLYYPFDVNNDGY